MKSKGGKSIKKVLKELETEYNGGSDKIKRDGFGVLLNEEEVSLLNSDTKSNLKISLDNEPVVTISEKIPVLVMIVNDDAVLYYLEKKYNRETLNKLAEMISSRLTHKIS